MEVFRWSLAGALRVSRYGVIAMKSGTFPTLIGLPAWPAAVVIGVTVPEPSLVT